VRSRARSAVLLALVPALAAAQATGVPAVSGPAPVTRKFVYSEYEEATIRAALAALGLTEAVAPEGRIVEGIDTVRLEVIEERDPAPRFLNVFHVVTRPYVVERELLLRTGDRYRETLADESRRNLAGFPQFSLVLVVAAEGRAPGTVRLVVITKDVWSLRLNWDATVSTHGLESLYLNPSETNLLGTHQTLGLLFRWFPASHSLGAQYVIPRLAGTHVAVSADAGIVLNNATGDQEGSFGDLSITSPLWSSRTEWAWGASGSWSKEISRLYSSGQVALFALDPATRCVDTPSLCVPWVYHSSAGSASAFLTRSFGWAVKQDLTVGFSASSTSYSLPDLSAYDPATVQAFRDTRLPVGEDRVGPYVQYRVYRSDFLRVLDLDTLALQEDYRLGPQAYLRFYPVLAALGSTRTLYGVSAGGSWLAPIYDGYVSGAVDTVTEVDGASGMVKDGSVRLEARFASPRTAAGRLVLDTAMLNRYANSLHGLTSLGGNSRLRGYASNAFVGQHFVVANAEFRSRALQLFETVQLGGVAFYDAGNAFDRWSDLYVWQSVGFGARVLFPQLDRVVFRIDVGFPLSRPLPVGAGPVTVFGTFGQAF
jgi:hypothetical protein